MIFFSADHHFYHSNIIKYCGRPFLSVEEMNEKMVSRWNEVVQPDDTVYYLGDFALANRAVEVFGPRLNGEKLLIMGNHDTCHPCHKKRAAIGERVYATAGFKTIGLEHVIEIGAEKVLLNHMPYLSTDPNDDKYKLKFQNYRPKDQGAWLLHGHIHEKWKIKNRQINVGVDVWNFYPVPITEIEKMLIEGK